MAEIGIVILAAGKSARLGRAKQLLKFDNKTFLERIVLEAKKFTDHVVVVLGARIKQLQPEVERLNVDFEINDQWESGMGSSVKTGVHALKSKAVDCIIITTCDQPYVDASVFTRLAEQLTSDTQVVVSGYGEAVGIPALFSKQMFNALEEIDDNAGAKQLILQTQHKVVPFEKGKIDIDTENDWRKFNR